MVTAAKLGLEGPKDLKEEAVAEKKAKEEKEKEEKELKKAQQEKEKKEKEAKMAQLQAQKVNYHRRRLHHLSTCLIRAAAQVSRGALALVRRSRGEEEAVRGLLLGEKGLELLGTVHVVHHLALQGVHDPRVALHYACAVW